MLRNADPRPLPGGWTSHFDHNSQCWYYRRGAGTSWTHPLDVQGVERATGGNNTSIPRAESQPKLSRGQQIYQSAFSPDASNAGPMIKPPVVEHQAPPQTSPKAVSGTKPVQPNFASSILATQAPKQGALSASGSSSSMYSSNISSQEGRREPRQVQTIANATTPYNPASTGGVVTTSPPHAQISFSVPSPPPSSPSTNEWRNTQIHQGTPTNRHGMSPGHVLTSPPSSYQVEQTASHSAYPPSLPASPAAHPVVPSTSPASDPPVMYGYSAQANISANNDPNYHPGIPSPSMRFSNQAPSTGVPPPQQHNQYQGPRSYRAQSAPVTSTAHSQSSRNLALGAGALFGGMLGGAILENVLSDDNGNVVDGLGDAFTNLNFDGGGDDSYADVNDDGNMPTYSDPSASGGMDNVINTSTVTTSYDYQDYGYGDQGFDYTSGYSYQFTEMVSDPTNDSTTDPSNNGQTGDGSHWASTVGNILHHMISGEGSAGGQHQPHPTGQGYGGNGTNGTWNTPQTPPSSTTTYGPSQMQHNTNFAPHNPQQPHQTHHANQTSMAHASATQFSHPPSTGYGGMPYQGHTIPNQSMVAQNPYYGAEATSAPHHPHHQTSLPNLISHPQQQQAHHQQHHQHPASSSTTSPFAGVGGRIASKLLVEAGVAVGGAIISSMLNDNNNNNNNN